MPSRPSRATFSTQWAETMWQLAQINIARFMRDKDDPANSGFMDALDRVNSLADAAPGFVWRLIGDGNDATDIEVVPGDPRLIVNMSVWEDVASLEAFAYRQSNHLEIMRQRKQWFETISPAVALWWVKAGHQPSVAEGMARLETLKNCGSGPESFTFRTPFPPPTAG